MTIQILNKNRIDLSINSWALTNITEYHIDEGSYISERYNETLDSGTVFISNLDNEIEIEPYDIVLIKDENNRIEKYMAVDTYSKTQTSIVPMIFSYEINLFSETKLLENYICPDLSITVNSSNKSIYYYLNVYNNLFGKKVYKSNSRTTQYNAWHFSDTVIQKFDNIICPEMQWNKPTLREVFNDLMMIDDCIPVLKNGIIDLIDLTKSVKMSEEKKSHINYIKESRSSEDYVSEIQMTMQNVLGGDTVFTAENLVLLPESGVSLTDSNGILKTTYPIINIKSLKAHLFTPVRPAPDIQNTTVKYTTLDITSLVKEDKEWQTLPVVNKMSLAQTTLANIRQYQNTSLHFKRGDTRIIGFGTNVRGTAIGDEITLTKRLAHIIDSTFGDGIDKPQYYLFFTIEYETITSDTFSASKRDYPTFEKTIIDNQTNSWVNSTLQGSLEYMKVNRLGNKQLLINAIYEDDYSELIKIGDNYEKDGDNIVFECQYSIYNHLIQVNAFTTKDYVLQDYFTGVKSKIRTWKNAEDEAFERNDLIKTYIELSFSRYSTDTVQKQNRFTASGLANIVPFTNKKLKYVYFNTSSLTGNRPSAGYFIGEVLSRVKGNSVVLSVGLKENWYMGEGWNADAVTSIPSPPVNYDISITNDYADLNGLPIRYHKYVDDNGNFDQISLYLSDKAPNEIPTGNIRGTDFFDNIQNNQFDNGQLWRRLINQPYIRTSDVDVSNLLTFNIYEYKDLREIPKLSLEFEVCSATEDISFTKEFVKMLSIVSDTFNIGSLKVWIGDIYYYNRKNPTLESATIINNARVLVEISDRERVNIRLYNLAWFLPRTYTLFVTDANDNILLSCIPPEWTTTTLDIILNYIPSRDKNSYGLIEEGVVNYNIKTGEFE